MTKLEKGVYSFLNICNVHIIYLLQRKCNKPYNYSIKFIHEIIYTFFYFFQTLSLSQTALDVKSQFLLFIFLNCEQVRLLYYYFITYKLNPQCINVLFGCLIKRINTYINIKNIHFNYGSKNIVHKIHFDVVLSLAEVPWTNIWGFVALVFKGV